MAGIRASISAATPSRRAVIRAGAAGAAGLALPGAPFLRRARAAETLSVNTWGGPWEEAARTHLFDPFTAETGIAIRTVSPVSVARLAAQVEAGAYAFDVTTLGGGDIVRANRAGIIAPAGPPPYPGAVFENGVASHAFATTIAWRTDRFPGGPRSWKDFWDVERFPGPRSLQRHVARILPIALLADGVPVTGLYPLDVDRAFASLDRIKPHIRVWWTQGSQSARLLRDGEVDLIGVWHGRLFEIRDAGAPVDLTWSQAEIDRAYWVVAKDTPREATARRFVDFAVQAGPLAGFCQQANYGPLNPAAAERIARDALARMPTSPQNYPQTFEQDMAHFGPDPAAVERRFDAWIAT